MNSTFRDLRFALRSLGKSPTFTVMAITTLAIGIGAATSVFSIVDAVLLHPLPYPSPDRIVSLTPLSRPAGSTGAGTISDSLSWPDFFDWRIRASSFEAIAGYRQDAGNLQGPTQARRIFGIAATHGYLSVLGISPFLGRDFTPEDEQAGNRSILLSKPLWQSDFGSDFGIVGKTLRLSGQTYTVMGVLPDSLGAASPQAPLYLITEATDREGATPSATQRGYHQLSVVARLKPNVALQQARVEMQTIQVALATQYPQTNLNQVTVRVVSLAESLNGAFREPLRVLFAAVCFLLSIACANVAGLLLARTNSRRGELALRAALGASRGQLVRQLLLESLMLSVAAGVLGCLFAAIAMAFAMRLLPPNLPHAASIGLNAPVLGFAFGVSVVTGLAFGVLPALRSARVQPALALAEGSRAATASRRQQLLRACLVIAETSIGLVLLVGAALLIRSFHRILAVDPGFDSHRVLTFRVATPPAFTPDQQIQFFDQLAARLNTLPGAHSATYGYPLPFSGGNVMTGFTIDGTPTLKGNTPVSNFSVVAPNYFQTLGIAIRHGRTFTAAEAQAPAPHVMLINDAFARTFFPDKIRSASTSPYLSR